MRNTRMEQMLIIRDLAKRLFGREQDLTESALPSKELKGIRNEQRAFELIDLIIREEGLSILTSRPYIAEKYSIEDLDGFDIIIPTEQGKIGIQIKSSYKYLMLFHEKRSNIPAVVVDEYKSDTRLKIELSSALRYAYSQLI